MEYLQKEMSSPIVDSLTTVSKFFGISGSIFSVGSLLAAGFLLEDANGCLTPASQRFRRVTMWSALVWAISAGVNIILTLANILNIGVGQALDPTTLKSFITQITLGQYMFFQFLVAISLVIFVTRVKRVGGVALLMVLTFLGIVAPVFQSHSSADGSHALVVGSLVIHVLALSLWVGGIFAIALLDKHEKVLAVPRFSQLALWAAIAVVISGATNSWTRLNFATAWHSTYAFVVIAKIFLTSALLFIGYQHRRNIAHRLQESMNWEKFAQLVGVELSIMIGALALGTWLSTNRPPIAPGSSKFDVAITVAGLPMPAPPNLSRILFAYNPDALFIGILVLTLALYLLGVAVLRKRGDTWPILRTISFSIGIFFIDFATSGGFGVYAHFAFSYHMIAHMILGMIAPIFIILSAPITLALRTLPQGRTHEERGIRGTLISGLHSPLARFWVNPVVALLIFDGSLFALYFTSLFGGMMQSHLGHFAMNSHFILSGLLFFHVIIGVDPNPRKAPHLVRIVVLFAAMSIHAFFSVALMSSSTLIDHGYFAQLKTPWVHDLLADQRLGGSIGWAMGEIPILLALVATFILWVRDDSHEAKRIDRSIERLAAMGLPDDLANYNTYLANLAQRDGRDE
jgi:putative copper resistance protein D